MSSRLEKALQKLRETKAKKEERERQKIIKKAERDAEKNLLKKKEHVRKLRRKQNKRAYAKRRKLVLDDKAKNNDKYAWYMVVIMKNRKRIKSIKRTWWKNTAFDVYNDAIKKNESSVLCPIEITETTDGIKKGGKKTVDMKYEILIVEKLGNNTEESDKIRKFRNEEGKFIDNVIVDDNYKIIAKHDWKVEEKFVVYGFHPKKNRKDAHYILDELLLKDCSRENLKRVFIYANKLIIQYDSDIDFVKCKTHEEAQRLYDILEKAVKKEKKNRFILFTDRLTRHMSTWILNELEKKTGWDRAKCERVDSL